jgi:hypothetical protein
MASDTNPIEIKVFPVIPAYAQCKILNKEPMTTSIITKKNRIKDACFLSLYLKLKSHE